MAESDRNIESGCMSSYNLVAKEREALKIFHLD